MSQAAASEAERLQHLHEIGILDTPNDRLFRGLAKQALVLLPGTSVAAVSLIDTDRQWFKTIVGLDVKQTPRNVSFCSHTIQSAGTMVVPDATKDPRFADNPLVWSAPGIRFYAGIRLLHGVGALCVIGFQPREATHGEIAELVKIAGFVNIQLLAHATLYSLGAATDDRPDRRPSPPRAKPRS